MSGGKNRKLARSNRPKTKLGLPDLDHSRSAVLDSLRSPESKRGYRHAIIHWYCSEPRLSFNKTVVTRYRIHLETRQLAAGTINGRLAAFGVSLMKPLTPACSVLSWPLAFAV
jgi:hypothetical protein